MLAEREREDHHVRGRRDLGRRHGSRAGGKNLGGQRDPRRISGAGDQDAVACGDGQACQDVPTFPAPKMPMVVT